MPEYNLKHYAHIGDAVWELFIREYVITFSNTQKAIHSNTVRFVRAEFQASVLNFIKDFLSEDEKEIARRGRNLPLTPQKKNNPETHTQATALEVLTGYFYLNDKKRLSEIFEIIRKNAL